MSVFGRGVMDKKRKAVIEQNEVSRLCTFTLGGYEQKVLIEGRSKDLPVVVTLHGGPGTPIPFSVGCRGMFPAFTDRFLMVYWDQLGCGINNYPIGEQFRVDDFADMTADLIREVKSMFPENPLLLFAMSWGSILSIKALERVQGAVDAVVVCGQIVRDVFLCSEVVDALEKSAIPRKHLEAIKNMRADTVTHKDLQLVSSCIRKYTDGYMNRKGSRAPMGGAIRGLLQSPDYRFRDFCAMLVNGYRKNLSLWKEILQMDLSKVLAGVSVPYVILQGDTDLVTPTAIVQRLAADSQNPNLQCRIVERTGHIPGSRMMERALELVQEMTAAGSGRRV